MPTCGVNGTSLFYTLAGNGPACLVMRGGLGVDHTIYRGLDPLGENLQLVYYDHRGNGKSGRPPRETLTMEQMADDAAALASHVGADKVVAFGHSYGGFIAQEFALRHSDRLASLILCSTTPGQLGTGEKEEESSGAPPPAEFIEMISNPPTTDQEYGAQMRAMQRFLLHRPASPEVQALFDDTIFDVDAMKRGFELLPNWSSVDRLNTIDVPTLLMVGSYDVFTSPSQSYRIARRVPNAKVVEFTESGHFPWIDEREKFFQTVTGWLGDNGG